MIRARKDSRGESALVTFRTAVKNRLEKSGMSVADLAKKARVGCPYLYRVLNGEQAPTLPRAERIAKIVGLRIETVEIPQNQG